MNGLCSSLKIGSQNATGTGSIIFTLGLVCPGQTLQGSLLFSHQWEAEAGGLLRVQGQPELYIALLRASLSYTVSSRAESDSDSRQENKNMGWGGRKELKRRWTVVGSPGPGPTALRPLPSPEVDGLLCLSQ